MRSLEPNNIELHSVIGTGADYEVRLAGHPGEDPSIVVKRPNPHAILKNLHASTESRTSKMVTFHETLGNQVDGLTQIIGHFQNTPDNPVLYSDELGFAYTVVCQSRAPGIPLNADVRARILKVPTGLGQTLFSLFPLGIEDKFSIPKKLMEIQTQLYNNGYLLFDLNPQNVFYSPNSDSINVIDTADLHDLNADNDIKTSNKSLEDYFVELIRYFVASENIPQHESGYFTPRGDRPYISIDSELDILKREFEDLNTHDSALMITILNRISSKTYPDISAFNNDMLVYFAETEKRLEIASSNPELLKAWNEARSSFTHDHWSRYDFDTNTDSLQNGDKNGE
tara:strand:- start:4794 stop:5816 length:1023 start_codon:yes stop_codon:yes gene_type:complete